MTRQGDPIGFYACPGHGSLELLSLPLVARSCLGMCLRGCAPRDPACPRARVADVMARTCPRGQLRQKK